jgi:predicted dehydrogenase
MIKVAVVGVGKMGLLHAGILNGLEGVRLSAIADTSKFLLGFAQSLKEELKIYDDYREMLDQSQPDAAVLATPVFLHVPMAKECAKRSIPFFMEKPLSLTSKDADELVAEVERKKLTTMVGYMMRYVETFVKAKQLLQTGALGDIITFNATIYVSQLFRTGKGWRYDKKESGGGVVIGQATHLIDLLRWYFGPVNYISAHTRNWYSHEVEDFAHVHFEFASGVTGWFDSSWSVRHHRLLEVSINVHAANGNLMVCDDYVKLYLDKPAAGFNAGWTSFMKPDLFEGVEIDLGGPQYTRQDIAFINAVKRGKSLESDVKNAHEVQKVVDAIYSSAAKHGEAVRFE